MIAYLNRKWIKTHFQVQLLAAEVISRNQSLDLDIACAEVATKNTTAWDGSLNVPSVTAFFKVHALLFTRFHLKDKQNGTS